ncbi:unnamed protein product [Adineta ricciae]|uniref:Uncharacterized protein n=1 Tax=Adineta ricciae TaxID=249248 RepID=A0A814FJ81_ADIRI|nr:unnamed protein product [Adineta ricciae]CAF1050413.1 unnamed protein product [Adineta ricciae]
MRNFKVYFANQHVPDARWSDFIDLGQGYGKDSNHVFFMGKIMENVDPFSFQVMDNSYARDHQHVFQHGRIVANLQSQNTQVSLNRNEACAMPTQSVTSMNSMYAPDATSNVLSYEIKDFKVFFNTQYVVDARWIDFTDLGHGYGKDSLHVFYMGQLMQNAHSFSFEVLKKGYAKDKNFVFHNGRIVEGLVPIAFNN